MESHDSFFLYGDVCGFRLNAQFSGDGLDLATVLYRIALGGSLGELVPTLGKSSLSDSLDVSILWRTIPALAKNQVRLYGCVFLSTKTIIIQI